MNNLKTMNKKANIPITILVIGVVAICILTMGSFAFSKIKLDKDSGIGYFEDIQSDIEKFYFYMNIGDDVFVAAEKIGAEINEDNSILKIVKEKKHITIKYTHKIKA